MKIDLLDTFSGMLCVMGEICGVQGMTFPGNPIELGICSIIVMGIKNGSMQVPSTKPNCFKDEGHNKWNCPMAQERYGHL
jgi:hypothetical protein